MNRQQQQQGVPRRQQHIDYSASLLASSSSSVTTFTDRSLQGEPQRQQQSKTLSSHVDGDDVRSTMLQQSQPRNWWDMTRTLWHYEKLEQIGEGTYGQVYKAKCKDTGKIVALKKIRVHHGGYWGMPPTVIREIKILKRLRHPNLVQMVEVVSSKGVEYLDDDEAYTKAAVSPNAAADTVNSDDNKKKAESSKPSRKFGSSKKDRDVDIREGFKGNLFLVLEYVSHDLTGLMDVAYKFSEVQVKSIFKQLLEALQYMHDNKYVHRDIKSSNILIDHNFRVKLADFGLARCIEPPILDKLHDRGNSQDFTNKVITLWYRPPELLLGETRYGPNVDIWSAGCILAELILGRPLFTGKSDMDQLQLIFDMMGTPTKETWTRFRDLKLLRTGEVKIEKAKRPKLRERYQHKIPPLALSLIEKMLELDPSKRLTADRALQARYFLSEPRAPDRPEDLGTIKLEGGHFHEFQTKKKRREAKAEAEKVRQAALDGGHDTKSAQTIFDSTYREIMERVAQEGLDTTAANTNQTARSEQLKGDKEKKPSKSERRRSGSTGERDKEKESRKERRSSKERREKSGERSKDKERRHRERDKDGSSRHHRSESAEDRRKRKRQEKERRRSKEEQPGDEAASPLIDAEENGAPLGHQSLPSVDLGKERSQEGESRHDRPRKRRDRSDDSMNGHGDHFGHPGRFRSQHDRRQEPDDREWNRSHYHLRQDDFIRDEGNAPPHHFDSHPGRNPQSFGSGNHIYGPSSSAPNVLPPPRRHNHRDLGPPGRFDRGPRR